MPKIPSSPHWKFKPPMLKSLRRGSESVYTHDRIIIPSNYVIREIITWIEERVFKSPRTILLPRISAETKSSQSNSKISFNHRSLHNQTVAKFIAEVCKSVFTISSNINGCVRNECVGICVFSTEFIATDSSICGQIEHIHAVRAHILCSITNTNSARV